MNSSHIYTYSYKEIRFETLSNIERMHARMQEFSSGGVQVSLTKSSDIVFFLFYFLVHILFYRSQMVNFKEIYHFQGSRGVQHFPGGSNCLFPIETNITCDFPGGVRTPCPPTPLDPHLTYSYRRKPLVIVVTSSYANRR